MTKTERDIVIGSLLGDASLKLTTRSWCVQFLQSDKQKEYLFWKYRALRRIATNTPQRWMHFDPRYGKTYSFWKFQTRCLEEINQLRRVFYRNARKIVPRNIKNILTAPLSLAVWYMDDGGRRQDCHGMFLNTLSFVKAEQIKLQYCLQQNFGIKSRTHWISDGYRLYVPSSDAKKFCKIIGPYIIPSMQYKLPYNPVTTESAGIWRRR
jgi:hypothetical protein